MEKLELANDELCPDLNYSLSKNGINLTGKCAQWPDLASLCNRNKHCSAPFVNNHAEMSNSLPS